LLFWVDLRQVQVEGRLNRHTSYSTDFSLIRNSTLFLR